MITHILYNGNIITQDGQNPRVSALAISRERIVAYGSDDDMLALANANTVRENLNGKTVIPGLVDAHIHWQQTSENLQAVDVFEIPDRAIAAERVAERVAQTPAGEWIVGHGWSQDYWPDGAFPSAADLDAVSPNHPVYLTSKSVHAGWTNTYALRLLGIDANTPDPIGGSIVRDGSGQPTGLLLETAMELVHGQIPPLTLEQTAAAMQNAQKLALACGLTGFHDFDGQDSFRALQYQRERGELSMRVLKQINQSWLESALHVGLRSGFGDDWIRIGALKLFADGALGPRTASMIAPYDGEPNNYGIIVLDYEEMVEMASKASTAGLATTIHAIGDRAVHDVLNVFEFVRGQEAERGLPRSKHRHRIEHVQLIHPDDAGRLAQLDIIASMQPIHAASDYQAADRSWGKRSSWAYNPRLQLDQGVVVAIGSDAPVEPFEPMKTIHAAVTRQRPDGTPSGGWYPEARLTVQEALWGYTVGSAYAAGMEDRLGLLKPGYLADLVVIDRDLTAIPASEILDVQVLATMVGGEWRHGGV